MRAHVFPVRAPARAPFSLSTYVILRPEHGREWLRTQSEILHNYVVPAVVVPAVVGHGQTDRSHEITKWLL